MGLFRVSGVKAIQRAYRELPKAAANKVIRKALREAAKPIQAEAKAQAPKGATGRLKRAIKVRAGKRKKGSIRIRIQIGEGDFKGATYYGAFREYGTAKMEAADFMKRALRTKGPAARNLAAKLILAGIDREKKNLS